MKKLREILGEKFSKEMETWLQNNKITRNMKAREPAEAPSKPTFDRAAFDAKIADMNKKIDAEGPFITNKQSKSVHWDDKIADRINRIQIRTDAPKTVIPEPVDFTGSRHSAGPGDVKVVDDSLNKNWRSKKEGIGSYQQPPGFGTPYPVEGGKLEPSNKRMRDAYDAMGIRNPTYSDPLKTPPIVPVTADKPYSSGKFNSALAAKGYDQSGKKVTAIPKQTGVGKAETPLSSNVKIPSGVGITTPGSFTYSDPEKKPKQITDRVPPSKLITDRVPQGEPSKLDNTKGAVPIPKPDSVGINVKLSDKKAVSDQSTRKIQKGDTFWDIAGGNPEEVKRLKKLNPNINPSKLQIGQEIKLK